MSAGRNDEATGRTPAPEFPGADPGDDALLRHVVATGSVWFAGMLIGCCLPITGLLAAGWRPADLPAPSAVLWWCATGIVAVGIVAVAWAGCPVVEGDPGSAAQRKSLCIRVGVVLVLLGGAAALVTVLVR